MLYYVTLSLFPLILAASIFAAIQTYKLSRSFPSSAWTLKRWLMFGFTVWQCYGFVAVWLGYRGYLFGVLALCTGLNVFDYLLLRDGKSLKAKLLRLAAQAPVSGDMPLEYWQEEFRQAVRDTIKTDYLKP